MDEPPIDLATAAGDPAGKEIWSTPEWRGRALAWLDRALAASGIERTGEPEQPHLRVWATALKVPTTKGTIWLKAAGPGTAFEVGLYQLLHEVVPGRVLPPIAADPARGWIVLPDGGATLGDRLGEIDGIDALVRIMPQYAELQRGLAPHVEALLAVGVADMRPEAMPARFEEALEAVGAFVTAEATAADLEMTREVDAFRGTFLGWCERLRAAPGSPSLDHNDLHPWNVLVSGPPDSWRAQFYDWGDSVVSHPFASLLACFVFLKGMLKAETYDPRIVRIRDAYLESFSDLASHADLVETLELACRVGKVARAIVWARAVAPAGDAVEPYFRRAGIDSLRSVLSEDYIGGA